MDHSSWRLSSLETSNFSSTSWNQAPVTAIPEFGIPAHASCEAHLIDDSTTISRRPMLMSKRHH